MPVSTDSDTGDVVVLNQQLGDTDQMFNLFRQGNVAHNSTYSDKGVGQ